MYRALYRKWRPQRFEDVVGQRGIVTALRKSDRHRPCGPRLPVHRRARHRQDHLRQDLCQGGQLPAPVNGDPCGECEICKGIDNGSILDVVEMDAASNNGVDDIRDLRDETAYTPSACQYKVYIIDEVHMLSTAAFNALLKTLEEPPAHVIFILATTEIQKVPATILSRCQRYDFTRIGPEDHRTAGGVYRRGRALGADIGRRGADRSPGRRCAARCVVHSGYLRRRHGKDRRGRGAPHGGVTDRSYLFRISDALEAQDGAAALAQLAQLRQQSVDVKRLTEELIAHYRALMLAACPAGRRCCPVYRRRKRRCICKKARSWASEKPSAPSALWARRWST